MRQIPVAALLLGAIFSALCGAAQGGVVSGDPLGDGWSHIGDSYATGTLVRHVGGSTFFDVYSQSFIVDANSPLITGAPGTGWLAGDTIVGIGATLFSYNGATIFAKFGSSAALFRPDSNGFLSPAGDGLGSFSAGHGGLGSIQVSNGTNPLSGGGALNNGGSVTRFPDVHVYNGSSSVQVASGGSPAAIADVSRLAYLWNNSVNTLSSFEVFLNVSLAARLGDPFAPAPGDKFVLNVSNSARQGTDAYGRSAAVSTGSSVPEPTSLTVWGLGLMSIVVGSLRLRKARSTSDYI